MNNLIRLVKAWEDSRGSGYPAILATVVRVSGSHYRKAGARMLATLPDGPVGSVSGGCLESDLIERAQSVIRTGAPTVVHYDTTTETDLLFGSGLGCGGAVDILLEPADRGSVELLIDRLKVCIDTHLPIGVASVFDTSGEVGALAGGRAILASDECEFVDIDDDSLRRFILQALKLVVESGVGRIEEYSTERGSVRMYLEQIAPPVSLAVFGAGDDARPVCRFASEIGWQVTIVDHRPARVTKDRFPEASKLVVCPPDEIAGNVELSKCDAAVVMTHNYANDLQLVGHLLWEKLPYIGLLGASGRASRILRELQEGGLTFDDLTRDRLYAPVGLDIGADGPEEIALAIIAEVQMILNGGSPESMRSRKSGAAAHKISELTEWK